MKHNIYNLPIEKFEELLVNDGQKKFRATQIMEWVYRKNVKDFSLMSNIGKENTLYFEGKYEIK